MDSLRLEDLFGEPAREFFFRWNTENSTQKPTLEVLIRRRGTTQTLKLGSESYINRCPGSTSPLFYLASAGVAPGFETLDIAYTINHGLPQITKCIVDGHYEPKTISIVSSHVISPKVVIHASEPLFTLVISLSGNSIAIGGAYESFK